MTIEHIFVEEYRKELSLSGYPFSRTAPVTTDTGYTLPFGTIIDASVYFDSPAKLPKLTAIEKNGSQVMFFVGDYAATVDLRNPKEVLELYQEQHLFGGILVCDVKKLAVLQGWREGRHAVSPVPSFCPRCLEFIPVQGVQRLRAETGELFSGEVVLVMGKGGMMRSLTADSGFSYIETNFTGDPTYQIRSGTTDYTVPILSVLCTDAAGNMFPLHPNKFQEIDFVACNTQESNLHDDALRIGAIGSTVSLSLGGL
jgi:hypothetical protein